jgi:hypothetical protein
LCGVARPSRVEKCFFIFSVTVGAQINQNAFELLEEIFSFARERQRKKNRNPGLALF